MEGDIEPTLRMLREVRAHLGGSRYVVIGLILALVACGGREAEHPSGTLVVVVRQGADRVPFHPSVARIQRANAQISSILGHSIQIEIDGSLLPQDHDGAESVIAHVVEDVARDLDDLKKEPNGTKLLAFAGQHFERLTIRYSPAEAAAREGGRRRQLHGRLEDTTIDVVQREASFRALDRGDVSDVVYRAYLAASDARYGDITPDRLDASEQRAWFEYHTHGSGRGEGEKTRLGSVVPLRVRGLVMLASGSGEVAADARGYLIDQVIDDFATTYHHHQAEVESAPQGSPFRQAEAAFMSWLRAEVPRMSLTERGRLADRLWVHDFRKSHERDVFASFAFPGVDRMSFALSTIDAWIAAGHPMEAALPKAYDVVVSPALLELREGQVHISHPGRGDGVFFRWALAANEREDSLVRAMTARAGDRPFSVSAFANVHRVLRDESQYLRFLRRFESEGALWRVGADVHREGVFRPSPELLEESRRLWRDVPAARGHVLLWFARHADGSYHPKEDWPDLIQGAPADAATLGHFLDLGWEAFEILPAAWPGIAKGAPRTRAVTSHARTLLGEDIRARPGGRNVSGTLAAIGQKLCEEGDVAEIAELRAFATSELPKRPGAGLSDVIEATDPKTCLPRKPERHIVRPTKPRTEGKRAMQAKP